MWMTPFDAITSAFVTFELLTKTFEPATRMRIVFPPTVFPVNSVKALRGWWRLERPTFEALFGTHQDDPDFARGLAEGRGLTLDEAVARALSEP